jgi:hypothetical protein
MRCSSLALLLALTAALLPLAGCSNSACEETCRRVAECKLRRDVGPRLDGERSLPADPTCMSRCAAATPEYASCEGKKRECETVLECIPYR